MHSTINPALGHGGYEPPRPAWKFRKRTVAQAEPAEADEPPEPAAAGSTVTPELVGLGEAHFWPHAQVAGDLSPPGAVKIVTRGDGVWVYDDKGRRYHDSLSGMWLSNIGHGRREVADAVYAQICELGYAPDGTVHPATLRLAARVAALAPDPASRVFFVSGGSEAVETAMKMAKKFHRSRGESGRYKFISRRGSYHGATHGALSLGGGGGNNGAEYGPLPYGGVRVQGPDQYRNPFGGPGGRGDLECAREIERAILNEGPGAVAAVIGEPVSAAAGVHIMDRHGLTGRAGDIFYLAPPLCVTRGELDFLVRQLGAVIAELQADLRTRRSAA